ncbi:MAG: hypothetical protein NW206_17585 [Hyphomonadaceae bacterium]|nr:hypothetical protein [Hyphomonadaceae bacterium]
MADVLIVCVREDELQAKALADMFERAGFSVGGAPASDGALRSTGAGVVVWSQASIRSRPFLDAAQRVIDANKAVIASLIDPPPPHTINNAPAFALAGWSGDPEDAALDPLFFAVDRMVTSQRAAVGAAPARPAADGFEEPPSLRPPPAYGRQRSEEPRAPRARTSEPRQENLGAEAEHWRAIRDSRDPADFMDYLARYGPQGAFSEVAEIKLKQLTGPAAPPPPPAATLRDAAKSAQPQQRARRLEPPPAPARMEAPPRRVEPIAPPPPPPLPRMMEPPPRRLDPPPPPPRRDPPPAAAAYRRDYDRPPTEVRDASARNGGMVRLFILALLIGGGAFGANYFLNQRPASEQVADTVDQAAPMTSDVVSNEPLPEGEGVGGADVSDEPVQLDSAPPRQQPAQQRQEARRPQPQPAQRVAAAPPVEENAPPPAPRMSWANEPATTSAPPSAGPASLLPGAQTQQPTLQTQPQILAENTPRPTPTPAPTVARPPAGEVLFAQRPSARRIADLYPARAMREEVGGRVQLDCVIRGDLALSCAILSETPSGMGFGSAALAAANGYRAQPTLTNGQTSAGSRARLVIVFQPPQD